MADQLRISRAAGDDLRLLPNAPRARHWNPFAIGMRAFGVVPPEETSSDRRRMT